MNNDPNNEALPGDHERQDGPGHTLGFLELSRHIQKKFGKKLVPDVYDKSYCADPNWYVEAIASNSDDPAICYCAQTIINRYILRYRGVYGTSMLIGSVCMQHFENEQLLEQAEADMVKAKRKRKRKADGDICRKCKEPLCDLRLSCQKSGFCTNYCYNLYFGKQCVTCNEPFIPKQDWMKECLTCYRKKIYYYCDECGAECKAFQVKKETRNKGRWFASHNCNGSNSKQFKWLEDDDMELKRSNQHSGGRYDMSYRYDTFTDFFNK